MFKKIKNLLGAEKKSFYELPLGRNPFLKQVFFGGRVTPYEAAEFYQQSTAVANAIDMIADEVEQIIPVVELSDGTLTNEHPVLELLKKPNEFEDYCGFIGKLSRNYLLNRDAYIYAEGLINRPPINIFPVNNQTVSITQDGVDRKPRNIMVTQGFGVGTYVRDVIDRKALYLDGNLKEIYQIHGYSSRVDDSFADSPLEAAALEAKQQILGKNHNLKLIDNGGRLSMAIILKGDEPPTQDQYDEFERRVTDKFQGPENAGRIAVFGARDADVKEMGQTNKDMDYSKLDQASSNAIYARYKIPLPLVSTDRQTFNNFDRAIEDLYDRAVLPNIGLIFSGLTRMLKARYKDTFERITYDEEQIKALQGRMIERLKERKELGIESINELREGLPSRKPVDGGDTIYQPANLIPVAEDTFTTADVDDPNLVNLEGESDA